MAVLSTTAGTSDAMHAPPRTAGTADVRAAEPCTRSSGGDAAPIAPSREVGAGAETGSRTGPSDGVSVFSAAHLPSLRPPMGAISPLDRAEVAIPLEEENEVSSESASLVDPVVSKLDEKHSFGELGTSHTPSTTPTHMLAKRSTCYFALALTCLLAISFVSTMHRLIPCPGNALRQLRHAHAHNAHSPAQAVAMASQQHRNSKKTNVIFMISDGYGPASETLTRAFVQAMHAQAQDANALEHVVPPQLPLDKLLVGQHRSMSTDSLITDSAAGATAFGSAVKSYNGAIGVVANVSGPGGTSPVGTIFEAAKVQRGMLTGVVVTSRLTDATPACFVSHADDRTMEPLIAEHIVRGSLNGKSTRPGPSTYSKVYPRTLDLAVGGGACAFLHSSHPLSCRKDSVNLLKEARSHFHVSAPWLEGGSQALAKPADVGPHAANEYVPTPGEDDLADSTSDRKSEKEDMIKEEEEGYATVHDQLVAKTKSRNALPFLGLLAPYNTPYEVDRLQLLSKLQGTGKEKLLRSRWPSLKDLSISALNALHADQTNTNGFMLMIEGSQIDLCAHENDPACHAFEAAAYQRAIAAVQEWVDEHNNAEEQTILVSTSDHETGGLTLGRQLTSAYPNYAYYPERLIHAKASAVTLSRKLLAHVANLHTDPMDEPAHSKLADWVRVHILGNEGAGFGPETGGPVRDDEVDTVLACVAKIEEEEEKTGSADENENAKEEDEDEGQQRPIHAMIPPINTHDTCRRTIGDLVSRRVEVGWSTEGHSGVDINVYAHGGGRAARDGLKGNMDNTDIAKFIVKTLDLNLNAITEQLQATYH